MLSEKIRFNPGYYDALLIGRKIKETGARVVYLDNGSGKPHLEQIINQSILGKRLDSTSLPSYERKELSNNVLQVITICDLDGVFSLPTKALNQNERRIPLHRLRILWEIAQKSNETWLITSRLNLDNLQSPLVNKIIDYFRMVISPFPFLSDSDVTRLEKFSGGKLAVLSNKKLSVKERAKQIQDIVNNKKKSIAEIIIVGSSLFDRRAVEIFCRKNPDLAKFVIFFDTCHIVI